MQGSVAAASSVSDIGFCPTNCDFEIRTRELQAMKFQRLLALLLLNTCVVDSGVGYE